MSKSLLGLRRVKAISWVISLFLLIILVNSVYGAECSARGRPILQNGVLKADNGQLLIGEHVAMTYWNVGVYDKPEIYNTLASYNMNTVRLLVYRNPVSSCSSDPKNCDTKEVAAERIQKALDVLTPLGFYAIIDYHPVGGYNKADALDWWSYIAPKFAEYTNVIYELSNEPNSDSNKLSDVTVAYERELHALVRAKAPNTPIIIWSLLNLDSYNADYVRKLGKIDSNTIVGFHRYGPKDLSLINTLKSEGFTLFMTEDQEVDYCGSNYDGVVDCYDTTVNTWMQYGTGFILLKAYPLSKWHTNYLKSMNIAWPKDPKVSVCASDPPIINPPPVPVNSPPSNPSVSVASNDDTVNSDLHCYVYIDDPDSTHLNVTIQWIKNNNVYRVVYLNDNKPKITLNNILSKSELTVNDVWYCKARVYDGKSITSWINSKTIKIISNPVIINKDDIRINAGGLQYTDNYGNIWIADKYYNTGTNSSTTSPISGTLDDKIYQTERYDTTDLPELSYNIPVQNGDYDVTLDFVEMWSGAFKNNIRVFDVYIQNNLVIDNLDIFKEVGANTKLSKTFKISVNSNNINIRFQRILQNPSISGIEIKKVVQSDSTISIKPKRSSGGGGGSSYTPPVDVVNTTPIVEEVAPAVEEPIQIENTVSEDASIAITAQSVDIPQEPVHENNSVSSDAVLENNQPNGYMFIFFGLMISGILVFVGRKHITRNVPYLTQQMKIPDMMDAVSSKANKIILLVKNQFVTPVDQKALYYILKKLNDGYSYDAIGEVLKKKGYSDRFIDHHTKVLQANGHQPFIKYPGPQNYSIPQSKKAKLFSDIQEYTRVHIHEGFRLDEIKQVLLYNGHPLDLIEEAIHG
jgi:hypothetical protein